MYFWTRLKTSIKDTLVYKYSLLKILEVLIKATTYIDSRIYERELERKLEISNYRAKTNSRATTILTNYIYYLITQLAIITRATSIINSNKSILIELDSSYITIIARGYKLLLIDEEK
jgi:hypothetical protein